MPPRTEPYETPDERAARAAATGRMPFEFRIGAVVANRKIPGNMPHEHKLGHVAGFSRNAQGEVIIVVNWCDGTQTTSHRANLILDPDEWPDAWPEEEALRRMRDRKGDEA